MTETVICIPWRDKGDPWRQANLTRVLDHLDTLDIGEVLVSSDELEGPFNRSRAYNRAVAARPDADVYVFHEADMLIPADQLRAAVDLAATSAGMIVPFDAYWYLTPEDTEKVRAGTSPDGCIPEMVMANGTSNGACNVVSRESMAAVGRWDETFAGWGWDDRAMARAFEVACRRRTRYIPGRGVHLWHKPGWLATGRFHGGTADVSPREVAASNANEARYRLYERATTPARVRSLTSGAR